MNKPITKQEMIELLDSYSDLFVCVNDQLTEDAVINPIDPYDHSVLPYIYQGIDAVITNTTFCKMWYVVGKGKVTDALVFAYIALSTSGIYCANVMTGYAWEIPNGMQHVTARWDEKKLIERVKVASKGKCTGFLARYILEEKELNVRNKTRHLQEGITRIFNGFDIYSDEE